MRNKVCNFSSSMSYLNTLHEWPPVELAKGSIVNFRVEPIPPMLLVVRPEVFCACAHPHTLDTHDGLIGSFAAKVRIGSEASYIEVSQCAN